MVGRFVGPVGLGAVLVDVLVVLVPGTVDEVKEVVGTELVVEDVSEDSEEVEDVMGTEPLEEVDPEDIEEEVETVDEDDVRTVDEDDKEMLVLVDDTTELELDDKGAGIESRPGVYFVRS
jgi:hypothetical protein